MDKKLIFSDTVRFTLRGIVEKGKCNVWADEAKKEYEDGTAYVIHDGNCVDKKKFLLRVNSNEVY